MARIELELHLAIIQLYRLTCGSMTTCSSHVPQAVGLLWLVVATVLLEVIYKPGMSRCGFRCTP